MKEAGVNIPNSEMSLLRTCQHQIVSGCLGTEPDFSWLGWFFLVSLDSVYNTVPFPVSGNADFQLYFTKGFLFFSNSEEK